MPRTATTAIDAQAPGRFCLPKTMYRNFSIVALTTILTLVTGCPATARQISRTVSYHDLDLTSAPGVKALRHRLTRAVNYVCRVPRVGDHLLYGEDQDCRAEVMAKVQPTMMVAIELAAQRAAATKVASR
jgi:UrcA family protein